ncbi:MAG: hypothetical protein GX163_00020 [Bacteroidetes bacterium]|jgi:hypothetical protein|nr:hypothetical protein [Bacteroidota bacterium]
MANSNKNIITRLVIMIVISLVIYNLYMFRDDIFYRPDDNLEVVGIENFKGIEKLKVIGKVYEVVDNIGNYHGMGIIRIDIIKSNIEYYDPRDKQANYYCIIKNGQAEFYVKGVSDIKPNDSIYVSIFDRKSLVYNSKRDFSRKLSMIVYPRRFFDFIKRKGYQEI